MNKSTQTCCDECGKYNVKIHKVHNGSRYCSTCYARVFKQRNCPGCNELKRLPINEPEAICAACRASKPCVRCGRVGSPVGLMSNYGPVCNSCSPHFRAVELCEGCGKPSSHLSKVFRFQNDLRLCRKCQHSDYQTCPKCRRYRQPFATENGNNEGVCKLCMESGDISCNTCGKPMPGGRVTRCEECYWLETAKKRITMDGNIFSLPNMKGLFENFGDWLIRECGAKNAALSLHRYLSFFIEIEKHWGFFPTYDVLVEHFKAEGLRRVRRPMRWLSDTQDMRVDSAIRENTSEENRIGHIMSVFNVDVIAGRAIDGYEKRLRIRLQDGKTSVRSIRLALTPAISLLQNTDSTGHALPNQKILDRFLLERPGQQAAITGFINYINLTFSLSLKPKVNEQLTRKLRKKKLEKKLSQIIAIDGLKLDNLDKWALLCLEYFHGIQLPKKQLTAVIGSVRAVDKSGITIILDNKAYHLPIFEHGI